MEGDEHTRTERSGKYVLSYLVPFRSGPSAGRVDFDQWYFSARRCRPLLPLPPYPREPASASSGTGRSSTPGQFCGFKSTFPQPAASSPGRVYTGRANSCGAGPVRAGSQSIARLNQSQYPRRCGFLWRSVQLVKSLVRLICVIAPDAAASLQFRTRVDARRFECSIFRLTGSWSR